MVAINKPTQQAPARPPQYIPGAVCPTCYHPLPYPKVHPAYADGGYTFRIVQGWCFHCHVGALLLQFEGLGGKWLINKYQQYDLIDNVPVSQSDYNWTVLIDLPPAPQQKGPDDPPLVQTGPGGDYTQSISAADLDRAQQTVLAGILDLCGKLNVLIGCLRSMIHKQ